MSDPIVDPSELGAYLNDDESLNVERAELLIRYAQDRCELHVGGQLPSQAAGVVCRVAARGYISITSARQYQLGMADSEYGTPGGVGGIYLMGEDKAELDDIAEQFGTGTTRPDPTAFSIGPCW